MPSEGGNGPYGRNMANYLRYLLTLIAAGLLAACGNGLVPASPGATDAGSEPLRLYRRNAASPLEHIREVYAGETVPLEVGGVGEGEIALWFSLDTTRGIFRRPGELHLLRAGSFQIQARAGDRSVTLQVEVGATRPPPPEDPPLTPPEGESPAPQATPTPDPVLETPLPSPLPTPLASPGPTPSAEPVATPSPLPSPSATPSPGPAATATPLPTPVASDPFADAVVSFQPGSGSGFGADRFPDIVLGPPKGGGLQQGGFDVLSLGAGGSIVLKSDAAILDGPGADFIVFENAFYAGGNPAAPFAEPGEVAVSQDGTRFFVFPCASGNRVELYPGCAGVHPVLANAELNDLDPTDPAAAGGDAFDLGELGLPWARFIRIRDLSSEGTGTSAGFDLDALSVVHQ